MSNEQLVSHIKAGNNVAENMLELWEQTKRLIYTVAKDYAGYAEMEDLNQEGYIGLCDAVQHYNASKGVQFSSYAVFWIKQAMHRYICKCSSSLRLPEYAQNEVQQYRKTKVDYVKLYGTEPTDCEMRGLLGVSSQKYEIIKRNAYISHVHSMSEPIAGDEEEITLEDSIASTQCIEDDVIKKVDTVAISIVLWDAVNDLPGNMSDMVNMRYKDGLTQKEVGVLTGLSYGQAGREEKKALKILGKNKMLEQYYNQYLCTHHVSVSEFNRTWCSEVELAVLNNIS